MQPRDGEFEKKLHAEVAERSSKKRKSPPAGYGPVPLTPQYHGIKYAPMKSAVIDAFNKGAPAPYKKLKKMLKSYPKNDPVVIDFFKEHGRFLFRHALLRTHSDQALLFLAEHMPRDILQEVLRRDDFSAIESFLVGEAGYESRGLAKPENFAEQRMKFKALLKIDPAVKDYMESPPAKEHITENIHSVFGEALKESGVRLSA